MCDRKNTVITISTDASLKINLSRSLVVGTMNLIVDETRGLSPKMENLRAITRVAQKRMFSPLRLYYSQNKEYRISGVILVLSIEFCLDLVALMPCKYHTIITENHSPASLLKWRR